ncbi:MAG TPA: hypothetical protein VFV61_09150 [Pyrinomonadaceae bacterium]|nr:hypothetical protein [Pyrinomonadaceae bacterium]
MSAPILTHPSGLKLAERQRAITIFVAALLTVLLISACREIRAQSDSPAKKLPSAEKVVENYLKALGGKKKLSAIRDASFEWTIQLNNQPIGKARTQIKSPASRRSEMKFGNGEIVSGATPASAWVLGLDGRLVTLTGAEAAVAKLQALLEASHLINYKKLNVMARVISLGDLASDPAYIIEFSHRSGARLRYWFSVKSNLLVKVEDELRNTTMRFADYQSTSQAPGAREPQRLTLKTGDGELTYKLERASYNSNLPSATFDPPRREETLDVVGLLRAVAQNQDDVEKRVSEYAFLQKETDRELNDKGELKKESIRVYEVFPLANREPIRKLISENGVALSTERAAKETKRVTEEFEKAERERAKTDQRAARRRTERAQRANKGDQEEEDPEISQFLKVCEFVSPRREVFGGREAIVFDFRPRSGFKPSNRTETLISKLVGVAWIDPIDKQVMRLEARLAESFKMGGGLLLSLRPGAGLIMEQTRMAEGVWLPRLAQLNLSARVFLFRGIDLNKTIEWSDYRHFQGDVNDYQLDAPKAEPPAQKP